MRLVCGANSPVTGPQLHGTPAPVRFTVAHSWHAGDGVSTHVIVVGRDLDVTLADMSSQIRELSIHVFRTSLLC